MSYLILSALIGLIIGLIILLSIILLNKYVFKISRDHRNKFNIVMATFLVVTITMPPTQDFILETIFPVEANSVRLERMMNSIFKHKGKNHIINKFSEAEIHFKTTNGLRRLDHRDKLAWNQVRLNLAKSDVDICAGFWTGYITPQMMINALSGVDDKTLKSFANISSKALLHELDKKHYVKLTVIQYQKALYAMAKNIDKFEVYKLNTVMKQGNQVDRKDACWAMTTLLNYIDNHPNNNESKVLVSYLAQIMSGT